LIAKVVVDIANAEVDRIFDYLIPTNINIAVGNQVVVPFGARKIHGFVIGLAKSSEYEANKLKEIHKVETQFCILPELVELCLYLKQNFYIKLIDALNLCVPSIIRDATQKAKLETVCYLNADINFVDEYLSKIKANAKQQIAIIQYLKSHPQQLQSKLNAQFSGSAVNKLISDGVLLQKTHVVNRSPLARLEVDGKVARPKLLPDQELAVNKLISTQNKTFVLHGVTGSGKTEVYLNVIEHAINNGKTAIMLVPEISLTPLMVKRLKGRFGDSVAVLHSSLSSGERHDEWFRLYKGEAKVVIGARSAIFAPLKNLGVIIIDEEHDSSYISESNPRYNTHDVATFRAQNNNCNLILGSATPNIETFYKAKANEFELLSLPKRVNDQALPEVTIVDMLQEFKAGNKSLFSKPLLSELNGVIKNKNQAVLFINRRGFSSFLMCKDCGEVPGCEACDITLSFHKQDNELKCHYCGKRYKVITRCPKCTSAEIKLGSTGTERVVEELQEIFPDVEIFRMDNDTTKTKDSHHQILNKFENTHPAILVGTQMIAKGHDFPSVTLVGILDADLSLYFGGFRSTEKTFQLITQVAGRAGRADKPGKAVLQTYFPKHYVYNMAANNQYLNFYDKEINLREVTEFPPFSMLYRLLITSENDFAAKDATHELFMELKKLRSANLKEFLFLEAMKSPVTKIKNKFRYQVVIRCKQNAEIQAQIYDICDKIRGKDVTIFVELNPQNLT